MQNFDDWLLHLEADLSELFMERVDINILHERSTETVNLVVCQMNYARHTSGGNGGQMPIRQTAVILETADLDLPEFFLWPHYRGLAGKVVSRLGDMGDINFEDSPLFSKAYYLQGWAQDSLRLLFCREVRDFFAKNLKWSVRGHKQLVVIYKENKRVEGPDLKVFIRGCLKIHSLVVRAEKNLDDRPELKRYATHNEINRVVAKLRGPAGAAMRRHLRSIAISEKQLTAYLSAAVPREIPLGMKKQVAGSFFFLIPLGIMLCIVGVTGIVGAHSLGIGSDNGIVFLFLLMPLLGSLMTFVTWYYRRGKLWMLRHGQKEQGEVTDVQRTNVRVNGTTRHSVTVDYSHSGRQLSARCHVYGGMTEFARECLESGEQVILVVDPKDPHHVVCMDFLAITD